LQVGEWLKPPTKGKCPCGAKAPHKREMSFQDNMKGIFCNFYKIN